MIENHGGHLSDFTKRARANRIARMAVNASTSAHPKIISVAHVVHWNRMACVFLVWEIADRKDSAINMLVAPRMQSLLVVVVDASVCTTGAKQ